MSATEIIAEIKKLPVREQEQVLVFLQDAQAPRQLKPDVARHVSDEAFDKVAKKVLREHADLFRRLAQ